MIPKFRAWDRLNKGMCDVANIDFMTKVVELRHDIPFYFLPFSEVVLMQSTGLKDKNGVEIYEGDVTKLGEGGAYHICVVEFNNDELCYQLTNRKTIGEYIGELLFVRGKHMAECEVIGSIYKNPELLEVTGK